MFFKSTAIKFISSIRVCNKTNVVHNMAAILVFKGNALRDGPSTSMCITIRTMLGSGGGGGGGNGHVRIVFQVKTLVHQISMFLQY